MDTVLRNIRFDDYKALASWIPNANACQRWAGSGVPFPLFAGDLPTLLQIPERPSYSLVGPDDIPLAFGQHWINAPESVHLGRIIVAPHIRGQGLGRQLCTRLLTEAVRVTGAASVTLRVYRDNIKASKLYESLGFSAVEASSTEDLMFMRKLISSRDE